MPAYYLDIETTGLDGDESTLTQVQIKEFNPWTFQWGPTQIIPCYNETDLDPELEKAALQRLKDMDWFMNARKINKMTGKMGPNAWGFIPIGFNLGFEQKFLYQRAIFHGIIDEVPLEYWSRPTYDVHMIVLFGNKLKWKGTKLSDWTAKAMDGEEALEAVRTKDFARLRKYAEDETDAFVDFFKKLTWAIPDSVVKVREAHLSSMRGKTG